MRLLSSSPVAQAREGQRARPPYAHFAFVRALHDRQAEALGERAEQACAHLRRHHLHAARQRPAATPTTRSLSAVAVISASLYTCANSLGDTARREAGASSLYMLA